jgi:hypothetical protein
MASPVQENSLEPPSGTRPPALWKELWSIGHLPPVVFSTCCLAWLTGQPPDFTSGGLAARLLAVLLLDVLAGDGGVALLERALLDARLTRRCSCHSSRLSRRAASVVGPVQLAAVVDLGEVQVLALAGGGDLGVDGVEVGGAGAADGATGWLALGHVAADVALEAVLALGGAADLVLHLGRDALDVALVLALAEAATAGLEDLLFAAASRR